MEYLIHKYFTYSLALQKDSSSSFQKFVIQRISAHSCSNPLAMRLLLLLFIYILFDNVAHILDCGAFRYVRILSK